jgi:ATP-dependent DNA helicase DinG
METPRLRAAPRRRGRSAARAAGGGVRALSERGEGIRRFFSPEGALAETLDSYERRGEQLDLALAIDAALDGGTKLVAEAGTGVGKTLAYLVPVLASGKKVVVSTGTKNLQEQIIDKDLPLLERAAGREFDVVVMKGRSNYLCESRFERVTAQGSLPGLAADDLTQLIRWRNTTQTGDRAELAVLPEGSELWKELSVTSEQCTGRKCQQYETCWVTRMRRRAQECELLVVNHHLYFADAALRDRLGDAGIAILPPHEAVVFDEAHEVDEIAAQNFGIEISERRLRDFVRDVSRAANADAALAARMLGVLSQLELRALQLFDALPFAPGRAALPESACRGRAQARREEVQALLARVDAELASTEIEEAAALRRRAAGLGAELAFVLYGDAPASLTSEMDQRPDEERPAPYVRYTEGGRNRTVVARPLDASPLIRAALGQSPAVFVSATLAIGGDFSHFKERVGVPDAATLLVTSPFDYAAQARLYLATDMPDTDHSEFGAQATLRAAELIEASGGGAFVLCTSNRMLEQMGRALREATELPVLVQGEAPRGHLIERFREHGSAVLVATMSFWSGVDVPGSALRLVIIDRLPFASPGDPLVAARLDWLKARGLSPFGAYQLPHAALTLRQGFGRLIRRQSDRGLVALLDPRVVTKSYGKKFLDALPPCPRLVDLEEAKRYLATLVPAEHAPIEHA